MDFNVRIADQMYCFFSIEVEWEKHRFVQFAPEYFQRKDLEKNHRPNIYYFASLSTLE